MKSLLVAVAAYIILLGIISPFPAHAFQGEGKSDKAALENVDAVKALKIADQWREAKKDINSYVNSREVVFKFPGGKVKKIPLPAKKMVVAVAPYIKRTHV